MSVRQRGDRWVAVVYDRESHTNYWVGSYATREEAEEAEVKARSGWRKPVPLESGQLGDGFGHWLAGFVDGEGHFFIAQRGQSFQCGMTLRLRDDDREILDFIQERTGCGSVAPVGACRSVPNAKPQVEWAVSSQAAAQRMVQIFDQYPLRAKKARDYAIWREAVDLWVGLARKRRVDRSRLEPLRVALIEGRQYAAPVSNMATGTEDFVSK